MASTVPRVVQYEEDHNGGGRTVAEGILTVLEAIQAEAEGEVAFFKWNDFGRSDGLNSKVKNVPFSLVFE